MSKLSVMFAGAHLGSTTMDHSKPAPVPPSLPDAGGRRGLGEGGFYWISPLSISLPTRASRGERVHAHVKLMAVLARCTLFAGWKALRASCSQKRRRAHTDIALLPVLLVFLAGCATQQPTATRPFTFERDTFAYANELTWEYHFDEKGKWSATKREPEPDYTLHCFVVARSAKQFFQHARFDPALPKTDQRTYEKLINQVVSRDPARVLPPEKKIVIPGYANLREFSTDYEALLKEECGGAWQSYFQRGNWRMVFPFTERHQAKMADRLLNKTKERQPVVVHIARFPQLSVNHAIVLFDAVERENEIEFSVYDPNKPDMPTKLTFNRAQREFVFPQNDYFFGGKVHVYEIYRSLVM
jgi:hypothetical protein